MNIIVRAVHERTERECVRRCKLQGHVYVIREYPFGESIRKTYQLAMGFDQQWIPVVDADVLLHNDSLKNAMTIFMLIAAGTGVLLLLKTYLIPKPIKA